MMSDIEGIFSCSDLKEIEQVFNKRESKLSWLNICNAIKHEMYPKLASAIRPIIQDQKQDEHSTDDDEEQLKIGLYDIQQNLDNVIEYLKKKRRLAVEERDYLKRLIERAITNNNQS